MESATSASVYRETKLQNLINLLHSVPKSIFDPFHIYSTTYRSSGLDIAVDVLVPKAKLGLAPRPVIVRIHGGFLITGASLFPGWFSKWVLEYAELESAVIISADYRLLPEAKGVDILHDMGEFWKWFYAKGPSKHLAAAGQKDIELNHSQLLVVGESAGGT